MAEDDKPPIMLRIPEAAPRFFNPTTSYAAANAFADKHPANNPNMAENNRAIGSESAANVRYAKGALHNTPIAATYRRAARQCREILSASALPAKMPTIALPCTKTVAFQPLSVIDRL